jgi:hypothetical protein
LLKEGSQRLASSGEGCHESLPSETSGLFGTAMNVIEVTFVFL